MFCDEEQNGDDEEVEVNFEEKSSI